MVRMNRVLFGVSIFTTVFMCVYLYTFFMGGKLWWYEPVERTWRYGHFGSPVAMDYYGRVGLALAIAGGTSILILLLSRLPSAGLSSGSWILKAGQGYAAILTVLTLVVLAWLFSHRVVIPPTGPP